MTARWEQRGDRWLVKLKVVPRAGKNEIAGWVDGQLKLRVTDVAEKGKANRAVLKLLAQTLHVRPRQIELIQGATSRNKIVAISGIDEALLTSRLGALPSE